MVFDSELLEQLRYIQGNKIQEKKCRITFSQIVRDLVKVGIRNEIGVLNVR